jgi:hypothetical protein
MNEVTFTKQIPKTVFDNANYHELAFVIQQAIEAITRTKVYVNFFEDDINGKPAVTIRVEEVPVISFEYTDF